MDAVALETGVEGGWGDSSPRKEEAKTSRQILKAIKS